MLACQIPFLIGLRVHKIQVPFQYLTPCFSKNNTLYFVAQINIYSLAVGVKLLGDAEIKSGVIHESADGPENVTDFSRKIYDLCVAPFSRLQEVPVRGYCSFRVDSETERLIEVLAKKSFRTRSDLMRLLVHIAGNKPELLGPDFVVFVGENEHSQAEYRLCDESEVQGE